MPPYPTEAEARQATTCPGCRKPKDAGCIVCWHCFKCRTDCTPLKYWTAGPDGAPAASADETLAGWLAMLNGKGVDHA